MKTLLKLVIFLTISTSAFVFFSCKQDSPVESGSGSGQDYFTWSIVDSTIIPNDMYVADAANLFIGGYKNYKITDGVKTELIDPDFTATSVKGYDKNYVVFFGYNSVGPKFKIYNSGSITNYVVPNYTEEHNAVVIEPGKFIYQSIGGFSVFQDGVTDAYSFPYATHIKGFSHSNNTIYIFESDRTDTIRVNKFEDNHIIHIGNYAVQGEFLNLENEAAILKRAYTGSQLYSTLYSFTGSSWDVVFSVAYPNVVTFSQLSGYSKNFIIGSLDVGTQDVYPVQVWNGMSMNNEKGYPIKDNYIFPTLSNYKDNTIYAYSSYNGRGNLLKGQRTRF